MPEQEGHKRQPRGPEAVSEHKFSLSENDSGDIKERGVLKASPLWLSLFSRWYMFLFAFIRPDFHGNWILEEEHEPDRTAFGQRLEQSLIKEEEGV